MGFAAAPTTRNALAAYGIRATGFRWKWGLGLKGGTFPPHRSMNGQVSGLEGFDVTPGDDVNGDSCTCWLVPAYRTSDGRLAKAGLQPAFIPPVTASQAVEVYRPEPLDLSPLAELLSTPQPLTVQVTIPDGAIVINVPLPELPKYPVQLAPIVNVAPPNVSVAAPNVTVESPTVSVAAPTVKVEPRIDVKPAPVKIIREKVAKRVRFRRNIEGRIDEAEVTSE